MTRKTRLFSVVRVISLSLVVVMVNLPRLVREVRLLVESTGRQTQEVVTTVGNQVQEVAAKFKQGQIEEVFRSYLTSIEGTDGDILEVATLKTNEMLVKSESLSLAWGCIYLGTTVTEIMVPVTYRYHIKLSDTWRLQGNDNICIAYAPEIRPSLPPAIHTDGMKKKAESGWMRFNSNDQMDKLERSLTPFLIKMAMHPTKLELVQEQCRKSVARFLRGWLLREDQWSRDRFSIIKVVFPHEQAYDDPEQIPLAIEYSEKDG